MRVIRTERTWRCPERAWEGVCQIFFIPASHGYEFSRRSEMFVAVQKKLILLSLIY